MVLRRIGRIRMTAMIHDQRGRDHRDHGNPSTVI